MPRKSNSPAPQHDDIDTSALDQGTTALAHVAGQTSEIATMMGYELAYNRDRIVQEARFYMGTAAEAMLEAGKRLVLLKEHEQHGEFIRIVEDQLGIAARSAQQMMQAAVKYLSTPALAANAQALAHLGKTKMFELMTLDDDSLVELAEGGSVAGLTLDDVDRMTSRELKAALRDAQADAQAKDELLAAKSSTIDKLQTKQAKLKPTTPDEDVAQLRRETSDVAHHAEALIRGSLRDGFEQLARHAEQTDVDHGPFCAGLLAQVDRAIAELRGQFGIAAAPDSDPTPVWAKEA